MAHTDANRHPLLDDAVGGFASLESFRAGLAEQLRAGSRAAITEAVHYGLMGIEHGEDWTGSLPPATAVQARRAARNGGLEDGEWLQDGEDAESARTGLERAAQRPKALGATKVSSGPGA